MSSSDVVIRVEGLGKKYTLHHQQAEGYRALRDVIAESAKAAGRRLNPFSLAGQLQRASRRGPEVPMHPREEEFWALKDVSFEIRRGERVGIIGRNGAGKSTLLKILSRITEPTTGRVEICGRVASLLEVGTGFHPELTGRENIYLNGAILGMTRREIRHKFDEIVAFAEVERFLDTPVKRFSSGMYVRLAFAVAAHLEPEILVVDEVLAVGDAAFQKKCLGKLEDVADQQGRTILFVSHHMAAIEKLCNKGILLSEGSLLLAGDEKSVVNAYGNNDIRPQGEILANRIDRRGNGLLRFNKIEFSQDGKIEGHSVVSGRDLLMNIEIDHSGSIGKAASCQIAIGVDNFVGERICHLSSKIVGSSIAVSLDLGTRINASFLWKRLPLVEGRYSLTLFMEASGQICDWITSAIDFTVIQGDFYSTGRLPPLSQGVFLPDYVVDSRK